MLLGLGEKVVTRWERGKVLQTKAADVVLRLMDVFPSVVEYLRTMRHRPRAGAHAVEVDSIYARDYLRTRTVNRILTPSVKEEACISALIRI